MRGESIDRRLVKVYRRGSTMVEAAFTFATFALLLVVIMELGLVALVSTSVTFAAQRAARFASVRGSTSGRAATLSDVQSAAAGYAAPLNPALVAVAVTWSPNNSPGSTVQVRVSYSLQQLLPIRSGPSTVESTARQMVIQ